MTPSAHRPFHLRTPSRALLLLVAVSLVAIAVACGGSSDAREPAATATPDETPAVEPDPDSNEAPELDNAEAPPALTLTSGDASLEAGLSTFCWNALCADAIGPITPEDPLASDGEQLTATLASTSITEVSVTATLASAMESQPVCTVVDGIEPSGPLCGRDDPLLAWTGGFDEGVDLPATVGGDAIDVDVSSLGPGRHVVSFFVRFETGGDALYAVLLDVPAIR